jgi:hypothetical protein
MNHNICGGAIYGFGFLGAAFYFIVNSTTMFSIIIGFLKALAWPGILVYYVLQSLGA